MYQKAIEKKTKETSVAQDCGQRGATHYALVDNGTTGVTGIVIGSDHACAVRRDGKVSCWGCALGTDTRVLCWGANTVGQLDIGTTSAYSISPVVVKSATP
jgi:alpha-tubulin suppressor-like RCC1 family protein